MKKLITAVLVALFAASSFAADVAQPETPGHKGSQQAAEAKHMKKPHGNSKAAKQTEVQAQGSERAKDAAEAKHTKKQHGNVNDSADKRTQKDASKL
jgi:TolA-binding protein